MKFYSYQIAKEEQDGEEIRLVFSGVMKQATPETLEIAKREAYNGEYEIVDDGQPEPPPTTEQRVSDLEEQIVQADETAIALYEAQEAQEVINAKQDEALMEIYEMIV